MSLTSSRRAEQFARLLESGAQPDEPMLALADALRAIPRQPGPAPEFRAALRQRLVAVAAVQDRTEPASPASRVREALSSWRFRRRLVAVAAGVAVLGTVAGVGVSASDSLPGDPFYGIKRAAEAVQLATTQGQEAKGKRHLEFAHTRLAEVTALVSTSHALGPASPHAPDAAAAQPPTSTLDATLKDMDAQTRAGANDLLAVFRSSARREPLVALDRFTRTQYAGLRAVLPSLPLPVQRRAMESLALLRDVWVTTYNAAATAATSGPGGPTPAATSGSPSRSARHHGPKPATSPAPTPGAGSTLGGTSGTTNVAPPNVSPIPITPLPTSQLPSGSLPTGSLPSVTTSPLPTSLLPLPSVSLSPTSLLGG